MSNLFITSFEIVDLVNVKPIKVELGEKRSHLIITGRNGSGKTSLINAIAQELEARQKFGTALAHSRVSNAEAKAKLEFSPGDSGALQTLKLYGHVPLERVRISFSEHNAFNNGYGVCINFPASRMLLAEDPQGITRNALEAVDTSKSSYSKKILQYLVNLKAERSFARDDNDQEAVERIDLWFDSFVGALREVFERPSLELEFDRSNLTFLIFDGEGRKFSFSELSSGQSVILRVFSELMLMLIATGGDKKLESGVVIIDEVENHLHTSLQKKLLPFLVRSFPNFQFIVTTHSPFVLSSLVGAKILNLETGEVHSDFSAYSYEAIIEDYFQVDKYSDVLKSGVIEVERLIRSGLREDAQNLLSSLLGSVKASSKDYINNSAEAILVLEGLQLKLRFPDE